MSELWPLEDEHWIFRGRLDRVVDGDTYDFILDLGFRTYKKVRVRMYGIDTAEIYGVKQESDEYAWGIEQKEFVENWFLANSAPPLGEEWPFIISTAEDTGRYCRWPGLIRNRDSGVSLREAIINEYPGTDALNGNS